MHTEKFFQITLKEAAPGQGMGEGEEQLMRQVYSRVSRVDMHCQHVLRLSKPDETSRSRVDGVAVEDGEFDGPPPRRYEPGQVFALHDRQPLSERQRRCHQHVYGAIPG